MKRFLARFDTFGVPLTLQVQPKQRLFKSYIGGLFTLTIYSLSLAYIIHIFYRWQQNDISPKMFASSTLSTFSNLNLDYDFVNVGFYTNDKTDVIDPFLQQNNIITPLVYSEYEDGTIEFQSLLDDAVAENPMGNGRTINIKKGMNYYKTNGSLFESADRTILLAKCDMQYLKGNQTCASEEDIQAFFAQSTNYLMVRLHPILLDHNNKPVQNTQEYYFNLEEQLSYSLNLDLKTNIYSLNQDLVSSQTEVFEYISTSHAYGQSNSMKYAMDSYGLITYGVIYLSIQPSQTQITIQYPQIGELLASVGSILSLLFLLRYVVFEINIQLLKQKILEELIAFYYPEFQYFKIEYNIFRQIKQVRIKNSQVNLEQFKKIYNALNEKAEHKLSLMNLLYEQSRLFMILRGFKNQVELRRSHEMKISLNSSIYRSYFQSMREEDYIESKDPNSFTLDDSDFDLISLSQRREQLESINDEPAISNQTVYRR